MTLCILAVGLLTHSCMSVHDVHGEHGIDGVHIYGVHGVNACVGSSGADL